MPDFNIKITSDPSSAVSAAAQAAQGFDKTAASVGKAADETERYHAALQKMDEGRRNQVAADRSVAASEAERYQRTLEKMAGSQGPNKAVSPEDQAMIDRGAARKALLSARQEQADAIAAAWDAETAATEKQSGAEKEASGVTKGLAGHKGELMHIIRNLQVEYPLLGLAGRLALNPIVGATLALLYGIQKARQEYKEFMAVMNTPVGISGLKGMAQGMREAMEASHIAAVKYDASIRDILENKKSSAELDADALEHLVKVQEATEKIIKLQEDAQRQRLEFEHDLMGMSDAEYERKKANLGSQSEDDKRARERKAEQDELSKKKSDLARAERRVEELDPQREAAAAEVARLAEAKKTTDDNLARRIADQKQAHDTIAGTQGANGWEAGLSDKVAELWKKVPQSDKDMITKLGPEKVAKFQESIRMPGQPMTYAEQYAKEANKLWEAQKNLATAASDVERLKKESEALGKKASEAATASGKLDEEHTKEAQSVASLEEGLKKLNDSIKQNETVRGTEEKTETAKRREKLIMDMSKTPEGIAAIGMVTELATAGHMVANKRPITKKQQDALLETGELVAGKRVDFRTAAGYGEQAFNDPELFKALIGRMLLQVQGAKVIEEQRRTQTEAGRPPRPLSANDPVRKVERAVTDSSAALDEAADRMVGKAEGAIGRVMTRVERLEAAFDILNSRASKTSRGPQ